MGEWCRGRGNYSIETVKQTSAVEVSIESSREKERKRERMVKRKGGDEGRTSAENKTNSRTVQNGKQTAQYGKQTAAFKAALVPLSLLSSSSSPSSLSPSQFYQSIS